jgi:Tfp pilus assembly protein PilZ
VKCLLLADDRPDLLAKLEPILKHWGYDVALAMDVAQANVALRDNPPRLILIGANLLSDSALELPTPSLPIVTLAHPAAAATHPLGTTPLPVPIDIFELYRQIQSEIEAPPRKNLRLRLRLPGMYSQGKSGFVVAELLSLSMGGLLFRSPLRVKVGAKLNAIFPLLGHGKEVEVTGTVLYTVEPGPHNNYTQGFGLGFCDLTPDQQLHLRNYLEENFYEQLESASAATKPLA